MFSITTIMKAIEFAGIATPAAKAIYEGFMAVLGEKDQDELKRRYAAERDRTDRLHADAMQALNEGQG